MNKFLASMAIFGFLGLMSLNGVAQQTTPNKQIQSVIKNTEMRMGQMHKGMGMGKHLGMMENMSAEEKEQHMRAMQEHMLEMHDLSNKILAAKDPKEKEVLKDKQLELMKAHKQKMMVRHRMMKQGGQMKHQQQ